MREMREMRERGSVIIAALFVAILSGAIVYMIHTMVVASAKEQVVRYDAADCLSKAIGGLDAAEAEIWAWGAISSGTQVLNDYWSDNGNFHATSVTIDGVAGYKEMKWQTITQPDNVNSVHIRQIPGSADPTSGHFWYSLVAEAAVSGIAREVMRGLKINEIDPLIPPSDDSDAWENFAAYCSGAFTLPQTNITVEGPIRARTITTAYKYPCHFMGDVYCDDLNIGQSGTGGSPVRVDSNGDGICESHVFDKQVIVYDKLGLYNGVRPWFKGRVMAGNKDGSATSNAISMSSSEGGAAATFGSTCYAAGAIGTRGGPAGDKTTWFKNKVSATDVIKPDLDFDGYPDCYYGPAANRSSAAYDEAGASPPGDYYEEHSAAQDLPGSDLDDWEFPFGNDFFETDAIGRFGRVFAASPPFPGAPDDTGNYSHADDSVGVEGTDYVVIGDDIDDPGGYCIEHGGSDYGTHKVWKVTRGPDDAKYGINITRPAGNGKILYVKFSNEDQGGGNYKGFVEIKVCHSDGTRAWATYKFPIDDFTDEDGTPGAMVIYSECSGDSSCAGHAMVGGIEVSGELNGRVTVAQNHSIALMDLPDDLIYVDDSNRTPAFNEGSINDINGHATPGDFTTHSSSYAGDSSLELIAANVTFSKEPAVGGYHEVNGVILCQVTAQVTGKEGDFRLLGSLLYSDANVNQGWSNIDSVYYKVDPNLEGNPPPHFWGPEGTTEGSGGGSGGSWQEDDSGETPINHAAFRILP